jgi:hypothetical protein
MILLELGIHNVLRLRLVSKVFENFIDKCIGPIIRHYLRVESATSFGYTYPPPLPDQANVTFLINFYHRKVTVDGLTHLLCNYSGKHIHGPAGGSPENYNQAFSRLRPYMYGLSYFFEEFRLGWLRAVMQRNEASSRFSILDESRSFKAEQRAVLQRYSPRMLRGCIEVMRFLLRAFDHLIRPTFRQFLASALNRQPLLHPPPQAVANLLVLGGLDQMYRVLRIPNRGRRHATLMDFTKGLDPAHNRDWKRTWRGLGIDKRYFNPGTKVPKLQLQMPRLRQLWEKYALEASLRNVAVEGSDPNDVDTFASRVIISNDREIQFCYLLLGYDVTLHSAPP